jgi:protein disulfide-isomerase A6
MWMSALIAAMAIAPTLVSAAVFPKGGLVKEIDAKGFTKVMKGNVSTHRFSTLGDNCTDTGAHHQRTSVVAFVAPWCGVSSLSPHIWIVD